MNGMIPHQSLIYTLEGKSYMVFNYGNGKQGYITLEPGRPPALVDAIKAEKEAEEKRKKQMEDDREFNKLFKAELEKLKPKINASISAAAADMAEKAKKRVEKQLGRKMHGEAKVPPVEDLIETEEE